MNRVKAYVLYTSFFALVFILSLQNLMTKHTLLSILFSLLLTVLVFSGFITNLFKAIQQMNKRDGGKW